MTTSIRSEALSNPFKLPRNEPLRRLVAATYRRQAKAIDHFLRTGKKDAGQKRLPDAIPAWHELGLDAFEIAKTYVPNLTDVWNKAGGASAVRLGLEDDWVEINRERTQESIDALTLNFCESTNATTHLALDKALSQVKVQLAEGIIKEGEALPALTKRIQAIFTGASKYKARQIAWTETSRAVHGAQEAAAIASGVVTGWELLISSDACKLCVAIFSRCRFIRIGQPFAVIGSNPHYSLVKYCPFHPFCNCSMVEVLDSDPQPDWGTTLDQPKPATDDEVAAVAAHIVERDAAILSGSAKRWKLPRAKRLPIKTKRIILDTDT